MEFVLSTFFGVILGIVSGILPGIGSASILLTFYMLLIGMDPLNVMMCYIALVISSQYVASLTAIYTGVPGAESSFPTANESGNLIRLGLTQTAVAQNAIASVIGNIVGMILLLLLIPVSSKILAMFGAIVQMSIIVTAIMVVIFTTKHKTNATMQILAAFALMTVGMNPHTFQTVDFGISLLSSGIPWMSLAMGAMMGHAVRSMSEYTDTKIQHTGVLDYYSGIKSLKDKWGSLLRGSVVGFFIGLVPGLSYILSATVCYHMEQKIAKIKESSETDTILASLMSSDAAHCSGSLAMLLPLLAFGIPITASEGVIYNIVTLTTTTKDILLSLYTNSIYVAVAVLLVNAISMLCAWKLGSRLLAILLFPKKYMILAILLVGIISITSIALGTSTLLISIISYISILIIFYLFRLNPLPFIFGVLIFSVTQSLGYSIFQLYF